MKTILPLLVWAITVTASAQFPRGMIIDLTYPFDEHTIYWPTEDGFSFKKGFEGMTDGGYYYSANSFCTAEHGGTHIDAPIHFFKGRHTVDQIPLERLIGNSIVMDMTSECLENRDYQISVDDFLMWEKYKGKLPDEVILLLRTGYGIHWPDRKNYMGTEERGAKAVAKLRFPGLHPDAARWLVKNRSVKSIGIDTPSIDYGQSTKFESHVVLFEHNIPVFENVANLEALPERGSVVIALPMKIKGGSGGPLRIVAILPE